MNYKIFLKLVVVFIAISVFNMAHPVDAQKNEPRYPEFHRPLDWWRTNHQANLIYQGANPFKTVGSLDIQTACLPCHQQPEVFCNSCHQEKGLRPINLIRSEPEISLSVVENQTGADLNNCLSCHPQEALGTGNLIFPSDPGAFLPILGQNLKCPALNNLGREMALTSLVLLRAERLTAKNQIQPLVLEAQQWEKIMASPLIFTHSRQISEGFKTVRIKAEEEISRPALSRQKRERLAAFSAPFLLIGFIFGLSAIHQWFTRQANRKNYLILAFIFFGLSLGGLLAIMWLPANLLWPSLPEEKSWLKESPENKKNETRLFIAGLIGQWAEAAPKDGAPARALALIYQDVKQSLAEPGPDFKNGPPWPEALGLWAVVAKNSARMAWGKALTTPGQTQAAAIWKDQLNWLESLPDSPLKRQAALILIQALAEAWPDMTTAAPTLAIPAIQPLAPPSRGPKPLTSQGVISPPKNDPARETMDGLLAYLSNPEDLSLGLIAYGRGLIQAGFNNDAARVLGRAYETALYIKNQDLKTGVFLKLQRVWGGLNAEAGRRALSEALTTASGSQEQKNRASGSQDLINAQSLAKVARAWALLEPSEALTLTGDLKGRHEKWLIERAVALAITDPELKSIAEQRYQALSKLEEYNNYRPYLKSFDLNLLASNTSWLESTTGAGRKADDSQAELQLLSETGLKAMAAREAWEQGQKEEAQEHWRGAWAMAQVAGNYKNKLAAARLYQMLGETMAPVQPLWAAEAYQKAVEILTRADNG